MGTQLELLAGLTAFDQNKDFAALYQRELPRIYNFFRFRVGDDQAAEDLTAEVFEKAWRNRANYRHDLASFSTWLFVNVRRVATDHFRRHRSTVPLEEAKYLIDPQTPEVASQQRAEFAQLSIVLAQLAERERELVALKYSAGLTNRAIAQISGLSESNVSTILHRVTIQLRAQLENEDE